MTTLNEITKGEEWLGLGIAGNQAEHLDQAGEAEDFKDVVALENAPKGMFPWYIPGSESFLGTQPLSASKLTLKANDPLQPEPEIGLVVEFQYSENSDDLLENLEVLGFSAFNDCSRRIAADKISHKKNWGEASQGMAETVVPINDFNSVAGTIENYRLVCYLKRSGELIQYGNDTAVSDYCYFNQTLIGWITNQINTQQDQGPLEAIGALLSHSKPRYGVIGIGATCYTEFGNSDERFLKGGDEVFVAVYNSNTYSLRTIENLLSAESPQSADDSLILLHQRAVV